MTFTVAGLKVPGGLHHQEYQVTTGKVAGRYPNGAVAVVNNRYGKGLTRLVGTFSGWAYYNSGDANSRRFFEELLTWGDKSRHVDHNVPGVVARLHRGGAVSLDCES